MNITRDVITDLLPLYLAGEASADTRALLEDYLHRNPGFAATVRDHAERSAAMLGGAALAPPPDHEKATLERARRFARYRTQILASCLACTLIPLAFVFSDGGLQWMTLRDHPRMAALFWIAAAVCWLAYMVTGRRLRAVL